MRKWTKTAGLLFLAASAVYSDPAGLAAAVKPTKFKPIPHAATQPAPTAPAPAVPEAPVPAKAGTPVDPFADTGSVPVAVDDASPKSAGEGQSLTSSNVNVTETGTVEIHVNDASLTEVLRMMSMQLEKNILPSKDVRGTVTANLYDVTVREALDAILRANGFDYREKGNVIYVYSAKEIQEMEKRSRVTRTQIFRLHYTPAQNAANMIKPVLSADAQLSFTTPAQNGIEADSANTGGDSHATEDVLVITDYPEKLDQAAKVIKEIDRRPQQVLIEAVIMRATLNDDNTLGVDFTALGGVDFSTLSSVATGGTGSGLSQALSGDITQNSLAAKSNDSGFVAGNVGGGGLKLGLVKNNVGLFIQALEGITDTVVLANPKVLVLNKQKGEVHVGTEQGYRTTVTSETLAAEDVKFLETGTRLIFRPFIGDNGFIRLEVSPEDSDGSVNAQGLPNKAVTTVTSNLMVKDGHTIVIGGLFRESTQASRSQVPGFGSLPGVGPLFGKRTDTTAREEVIILLTPHIIKDMEAYAEASEEEAKQADRLRVGMRRGLMPWGRERLAESSYEKAQEEMKKTKPDRQKVLWYLDCATNLNPKFSEAINMKVRLTGQEVTSTDSSTIRSFVRRLVLEDKMDPAATQPADFLMLPPEAVPAATGETDAKKSSASALPAAGKGAVVPASQPTSKPMVESPAVAALPPADTDFATTQPVAAVRPSTTQPSPVGEENAPETANTSGDLIEITE